MVPGNVVFFKRARSGLSPTERSEAFREFQGYGYGVLLGHVPKGIEVEPPLPLVLRQMGELGFISFDDVIQLLGEDAGKILAERFGEKYFGANSVVVKSAPVTTPNLSVIHSEDELRKDQQHEHLDI